MHNSVLDSKTDRFLNYKMIISALLLSAVAFLIIYFGLPIYIIAAFLIALPVIILSLSNYNFTSFLLLIALFTNSFYLNIYIVVLIPFILLVAFLIERGRLDFLADKRILLALLIYLGSVLISIINSYNFFLSLYLIINFVSFSVIIFLVREIITDFNEIRMYLKLFIIFCVINGLNVITVSLLTSNRVFGFAGIVFVDYSAIAILILCIKLILKEGINKFKYLPVIILLLLALIFTQSRGALATLVITLSILYLFFLVKSDLFNFRRRKILSYGIVSFLLIGLILIGLYISKPEVFERYGQFNNLDVSTVKFETDFTESSIFSRLLLWSTSLRAFEAHPIIGIGAFSFPFGSVEYSKLSPYLYNNFVKGLSPHITYLAVLVETGLLGFFAFIFLISTLYKTTKRVMMTGIFSDQKEVGIILYFVQIYIFISMLITDAWLWGQCGILWGISIGLILANEKILLSDRNSR